MSIGRQRAAKMWWAKGGAVADAWAAAGLNEGLTSYWAMRTDGGTTVYDEFGTNDGSLLGDYTIGAPYGMRDNGINLAVGELGYATVSNPVVSNTSYSVSVWVRPVDITDKSVAFILMQRSTTFHPNQDWQLYYDPSNEKMGWQVYTTSGSWYRVFDGTLTDREWHHIAGVVDDSEKKVILYINGVVTPAGPTTLVGTANLGASNVRIAAEGFYSSPRLVTSWQGDVDEVAIWNRALSSNEVYQIYNTPLYAPYKE